MQAKIFLFAVRKNEENAVFSHLTLGESVSQVFEKFNFDLSSFVESLGVDPNPNEVKEVSKILSYFKDCSLWCLGSFDYVSGELVSHLEQHDNFINKLEVLKDGKF